MMQTSSCTSSTAITTQSPPLMPSLHDPIHFHGLWT